MGIQGPSVIDLLLEQQRLVRGWSGVRWGRQRREVGGWALEQPAWQSFSLTLSLVTLPEPEWGVGPGLAGGGGI